MSHIVIDARGISSSNGTFIERLLYYLQKIDTTNDYTVLLRKKDKKAFIPTSKKFKVLIADFEDFSLSEQTDFKKMLDEIAPDLVHFCMPQQPVFYKGKHVTSFHDLNLLKLNSLNEKWVTYHTKQLIASFVYNIAAKSSLKIITPSEYTKSDLIEFSGISPGKITVAHESADILVDKIEKYDHPFSEFILYVGQQNDYKNIRRLAEAHQKLLDDHPDLGLILVGKKTDGIQKNENYFNSKDYKNILLTGYLPDAQRDWLYTNTIAFVLPSLMEGFGLAGLEAMAYGAPVVSSDATCLPEIYGNAAHYFDPTNIDSMTRAIDEVLSDEDLRNKLIQNGYKQIKKYSWHKMAEITHRIYEEAICEKI